MDFATLMQYLMGAQSTGATAAPALGVQPPSPAEAIGQQLDSAKVFAGQFEPDRVGPYHSVRGGRWGAAAYKKVDALQGQYETALGNPGAVQNDPRMVPELGGWGAMP